MKKPDLKAIADYDKPHRDATDGKGRYPTDKQKDYLEKLGYYEKIPDTSGGCADLIDDLRKVVVEKQKVKLASDLAKQKEDLDKTIAATTKTVEKMKEVRKCPKCNTQYSPSSQEIWGQCGKWFCENCDKKELARHLKSLTEDGSSDPEKWKFHPFYGYRRKTGNYGKHIR